MRSARINLYTFSWIVTITLLIGLITAPTYAASRGITVKAKTPSGSYKEIQLYSGYYALDVTDEVSIANATEQILSVFGTVGVV
jgi:hypothetical protein